MRESFCETIKVETGWPLAFGRWGGTWAWQINGSFPTDLFKHLGLAGYADAGAAAAHWSNFVALHLPR